MEKLCSNDANMGILYRARKKNCFYKNDGKFMTFMMLNILKKITLLFLIGHQHMDECVNKLK